MEFGGLSLGRGVHVVFHCGSSCNLGGRAFAGHTRPIAVLTPVTKGWRVWGRDEVRGQPSRSLSPTLARGGGGGRKRSGGGHLLIVRVLLVRVLRGQTPNPHRNASPNQD